MYILTVKTSQRSHFVSKNLLFANEKHVLAMYHVQEHKKHIQGQVNNGMQQFGYPGQLNEWKMK